MKLQRGKDLILQNLGVQRQYQTYEEILQGMEGVISV